MYVVKSKCGVIGTDPTRPLLMLPAIREQSVLIVRRRRLPEKKINDKGVKIGRRIQKTV